MKVKFRKSFEKSFKKQGTKVRRAVTDRLELFGTNPTHRALNNHKLRGEFQGYRSINITGDIRAIFYYDKKRETAIFVALGSHSDLYS